MRPYPSGGFLVMAEKPLQQQFQDDIDKVVDKYRDQGLTVGGAVGVLIMVALDVRDNAATEEDDPI